MNLTVNVFETADYINTTPLEILAGDIVVDGVSSSSDGSSMTSSAEGEVIVSVSKSGYIPYSITIDDVGIRDQSIDIVLLKDLDINDPNYHKPFPTFFTFRDWGSYQITFYYATSYKGQSSFIKYNSDGTEDNYYGTKALIEFDGPGEYSVKSLSVNDGFSIYFPLKDENSTNITVEEYKASIALSSSATVVRPDDGCYIQGSEVKVDLSITQAIAPVDDTMHSVYMEILNPKGVRLYELSFLYNDIPDDILFDVNDIGAYTVNVTLEDYENNIYYEESIILEGCDYFSIDYSSCGSYNLTNYGTNSIRVVSEIEDIDVEIEAGESYGYTPSSERVVRLSTNIIGEDTKKIYLINNHCGIEMCMAAYIEDLLCAPRDRCTPCPPESELKQMYLFYNTYFMKVHQLFYQNSFFEALSDEVIDDITKIENLASKISEYCSDSSIDSCCK